MNTGNQTNPKQNPFEGAVLSTEAPPSPISSSRKTSLTIQDVAGPGESPAETAMLKSIEESRHESGASSEEEANQVYWADVPKDFDISPDDNGMDNKHNGDDDDEDDDDNDRNTLNSPSSFGGSNHQRTPSNRLLLTKESSRSLLQQAHHRRGKSVEATLNGLALALSALEEDAGSRHGRRNDSDDSVLSDSPSEVGQISSASDFGRQGLRLHEHTEAGSRWARLRDNLAAARHEIVASGDSTSYADSRNDTQGNTDSPNGSGVNLFSGTNATSDPQKNTDIEAQTMPNASSNKENMNGSSVTKKKKKTTRKHKKKKKQLAMNSEESDLSWGCLNSFFRPRRKQLASYIKTLVFFILLPLVGVAAILFYLVENPPTGEAKQGSDGVSNDTRASISYILLFCARQVITFSLSLAMQAFLVDFLALNTRVLLRLVGPVVSLVIVQSRGWPMIFFWWGIFNFCILFGDPQFAFHWGHALDIGLFNERNPSGNFANNEWYRSALFCMISVSIVAAVKRFLMGLYFGRKTFAHYGQPLAKVMNKMLIVTQVAALAKDIEDTVDEEETAYHSSFHWDSKRRKQLGASTTNMIDDEGSVAPSVAPVQSAESDTFINTSNRDPLTGSLRFSEKIKMMQLLDRWEEPERNDRYKNETASISAVLNFRKALTFIKKDYPFSRAFGPADSREECIGSSQKVYARLMKRTPKATSLPFETIALLAMDSDGILNQDLTKSLVKLFRPDRDGNLSMLDFVKSVDKVYKEFRLLDATIENSSQIDRAFERIFNVLFYTVVVCVTLSQLGFDPLALFLSLSSVILGFAFMIGSASSKYFEGVLFILGRRPYGIGDLIAVGNSESNTGIDGALPWLVENVTLFETEVTHLPTMERASLSNGALAGSRIINWHRSPTARFHIFLNFPVDITYEQLVLFKKAVEEYLKARPREWLALNGFRANRIFADKGYMEHLVIVQHREAWSQVGAVLDSKANLTTFCLDVAKQLNMHYKAPPLPVDLQYRPAPEDTGRNAHGSNEDFNADALAEAFRSSALYKHNIVC